jgi:hypothetical protein
MDPVAGSVGDTTLQGTVTNGNGIRDDLEAYIAQTYSDATQLSIMMNYATAISGFLLATSQASAATAQLVVDQASVCGENNFGLSQFQVQRVTVQAVLLNNATRLQTYFANEQLIDGMSFPRAGSVTCNLDGEQYNGTP